MTTVRSPSSSPELPGADPEVAAELAHRAGVRQNQTPAVRTAMHQARPIFFSQHDAPRQPWRMQVISLRGTSAARTEPRRRRQDTGRRPGWLSDQATIGRVDVLEGIAPNILETLVNSATEHRLEPQQYLSPEDYRVPIFLVVRGAMQRVLSATDGREFVCQRWTAPDCMGLTEWISGAHTEWTAQALVTSRVLELHPDARDLLLQSPCLKENLLRAQGRLVRSFIDMQASLAFDPVAVRLAQRLADLAASPLGLRVTDGIRIHAPLGMNDLARFVGATPRSVHRALAELGDLVRKDGPHFVITDLERLRSVAQAR